MKGLFIFKPLNVQFFSILIFFYLKLGQFVLLSNKYINKFYIYVYEEKKKKNTLERI